jgi:hypothetical protein
MSEAETYDVDRSRRTFLITGISLAAAGSVPIAALAATGKTNAAAVAHSTKGRQTMSTITTKDGPVTTATAHLRLPTGTAPFQL